MNFLKPFYSTNFLFLLLLVNPLVACSNNPKHNVPADTLAQTTQAKSFEVSPTKLPDALDTILDVAIQDGAFPGAALAIGTAEGIVKLEGYGTHTYTNDTPVTPNSKFDLASLTKVIGTTTAVMHLYDAGKLSLDDKVTDYFPEFGQNGKDVLTLRHLMTHTGGLKPFYPFYTMDINSREEALDFIMKDKLYYTPGTKMQYSDLDMILMGLIVERISGQTLDNYLKENFWKPLGMNSTEFRPSGGNGIDETIVPTEQDDYFRHRLVQGEVHDEAAWILGGTAGHAGLFSTAHDLAIFAQLMLNKGKLNGIQYIKPETIEYFTKAVDPSRHTRAIGWDTRSKSGYSSAGTLFGKRSFGHTGFTGTSIWFDPDKNYFVILLTNRVHPTRENRKISGVRVKVADAAYQILETNPPVLEREIATPPEQKNDW